MDQIEPQQLINVMWDLCVQLQVIIDRIDARLDNSEATPGRSPAASLGS